MVLFGHPLFGHSGGHPLWLGTAALLAIALDAVLSWRQRGYDAGETLATLVIALGGRVFGALTAGLTLTPLLWLYQHRLFTPPAPSPAVLAGLFFAVEFCYYWHHRAMHTVRWFWITHRVHHSATKLNLCAALRLGWGGSLTGGFLFYAPLVLIGFPPGAVMAMLGGGLVFQFFLHVATPPHLGPLERIFNTPRHHQVHHAANEAVACSSMGGKNFGGVLMLFDHLFGSFAEAPSHEPLRFGLSGGTAPTRQPFRLLLSGWIGLFQSLRRARGWQQWGRALLGRPES